MVGGATITVRRDRWDVQSLRPCGRLNKVQVKLVGQAI